MPGMHRDRIEKEPGVRKQEGRRNLVQLAAAALANGYAYGFARGTIFTGAGKAVCVPVLNCYSCPGALGACPVGALQNALGSRSHVSFYVLGCLLLFGVVLGRLVCGFLCPFGFLQDLLYKIPGRKLRVPGRLDRAGRFLKYLILLLFVVLLPLFATNAFGIAPPYFCKYICPAGTLQGGLPHLLSNETLRALAGGLFFWKLALLLLVLLGAVFISRFFCRYLCPLGAFYGLFSRVSLSRMELDAHACVDCGRCETVCPMAVDPRKGINGTECIRCGKCGAACPAGAIRAEALRRVEKGSRQP